MNAPERAVVFGCAGESLLGVLSLPAAPAELGVLVVVGGPQYRAGSHRQFVQLARAAAEAGFAALRFDARGMGDSSGAPRTFEELDADVDAAIDAFLAAVPGLRRVVLLGLCDGASAALLHIDAHPRDERIAGLCLMNPWVRSTETLAKTHLKHYYTQRLRSPEFWRKLLRGEVAGAAWRSFVGSVALALRGRRDKGPAGPAPFQQRMARAWAGFDGPIQLVLSGQDLTAKEFLQAWNAAPEWRAARRHGATTRVDLASADHTFSRTEDQRLVERRCVDWLRSFGAPAATGAAQPAA